MMKICIVILLAGVFFFTPFPVLAALSVDIVDALYASVSTPSATMDAVKYSFACETAEGTLGTENQQIYVNNENGANRGWNVTLAASNVNNVWTSGVNTYDFNEPTGNGCTNGQMTIDTSGLTPAKGQCGDTCSADFVSAPNSATAFSSTVTSITILSGDAGSSNIGDWILQGVKIRQKIPAEKPIGNYSINMVLTIMPRSP